MRTEVTSSKFQTPSSKEAPISKLKHQPIAGHQTNEPGPQTMIKSRGLIAGK
jgi:hypothetical protein